MQKITIKNRKGQNIVVIVEIADNPKGLAFVMHGLSGNKEEPHIQVFAQAFNEKDFTVVRFDTTNTFGESDGKYEDATVTNYYEDLEDVINWAKSQSWYQRLFYLAGHSLGGISVALYAEKYPKIVKGLAPISSVISGTLSLETPKYKGSVREWQKTGWLIEKSSTSPTGTKKLAWNHMVDRLKYDVLLNADKLTMPVLLIVGDQDDSTPYAHQKLLYDKLFGKKEIHIIKGAPHSFREPHHLAEIKQIFLHWIDEVENK